MKEIDSLVDKGERFLKTAELSLRDGDYDSSVSRCYYAMFFLAEALLLTKGFRASSHKGVLSLFGEHFAKTSLLNPKYGRMLRRAYDFRQKGDYAMDSVVTKKDADEVLENARDFLREAEQLLVTLKK